MIKKYLPLVLSLFILSAKGQKLEPHIVCYASHKVENTRVGVDHSKLRLSRTRAASQQGSVFEVEYTGFTDEAKAAFQHAVDIWASIIKSDVTIRISANWELLDAGVLGSAGSNGSARNFDGAPLPNIDYPIALAEKLARRDLNSTFAADINANFSSGIDWYYGLDGNTPAGQFDLVSVVLHEIGHGLGIAGSFGANVAAQIADHSLITGFPRVYDTYLYAGSNQVIDREVYDSQTAIYQVTTSGNITFNSQIAQSRNSNFFPPIFAPSPYNPGSSISHLDESTFPAGDPNSLMTPQIGQAEAIHDPGDVLYGMMIDMGWEYAFFNHTALGDTEDEASDLTFTTVVDSDMNFSNVILHYQVDDGPMLTSAMSETANASEYSVSIANQSASTITYYFSLDDEYGRTINGKEFEFIIGPDIVAPSVVHDPVTTFRKFGNDEFTPFSIEISDNIGIASAQIEYSVNGGTVETIDIDSETITLPVNVPELRFGDVIEYRIIVEDVSSNSNVTQLPASGFYKILVIDIITDSYISNFDEDEGRAFDSDGSFTIEMPGGFSSMGYHTAHPYPVGTDQEDYYLNFLGDIVLGQETMVLDYQDIALIEPGLNGANFGSGAFKDYIALEGSSDNGTTWIPIAGYDASFDESWLAKYNESIENGNSTSIGDPSLYIQHSIKLNDFFAENSIIKLRFHLFSNTENVGWGWALKNFEISQEEPLALTNEDKIFVYPNPAGNYLNISSHEIFDTYEISDVSGRKLLGGNVSKSISTERLKSGVYFLTLQSNNEKTKRTFIKK